MIDCLEKYIFGPLALSEFKADYLDKRPLHLPRASKLFEEISVGTVDEYLAANEGNIQSFTRVLDGDKDLVIHSTPAFFAETQKAFIDRSFMQGATIKVEDFETRHPLMASICRTFEAEFGGDTYAMTFLTPPGRQGFGIHFDPVSSFIVQLSGEKHWKVYPEWVPFPTKTMNRPLAGLAMSDPVLDITLKPGDLLYIPAGYPHEAVCTDQHSLHMTIGLGALRPLDIISHALSILCEQQVDLRKPIYPDAPDAADRLKQALEIAGDQLKRIDPVLLKRVFDASYAANRPNALLRGMENYLKAHSASSAAVVSPIPNKRASFVVDGDKLKILPPSTIRPGRPLLVDPPFIELPEVAAREVAHLLRLDRPIRVEEVEGDLDRDSKLLLARQLAMYGLLEVVEVRA